jgi:hypothetical protein
MGIKAVDFKQGTREGFCLHDQGTAFPSKGFFFLQFFVLLRAFLSFSSYNIWV